MYIGRDIQKCVAFVGRKTNEGIAYGATAFFYTHSLSEKWAVPAIITARHVIDKIKESSQDGQVYVRINSKSGDEGFVVSSPNEWLTADDASIDLAALPVHWDEFMLRFDAVFIRDEMNLTEADVDQYSILPGMEIVIVGCFVNHLGSKSNTPILRSGHLAALPSEPVYVEFSDFKGYAKAILIESHSIGGLSGSPVFVYIPPWRIRGGAMTTKQPGEPYLRFLGSVHGHWHRADSENYVPDVRTPRDESLNTGIAIVTPHESLAALFAGQAMQTEIERRNALLPADEQGT